MASHWLISSSSSLLLSLLFSVFYLRKNRLNIFSKVLFSCLFGYMSFLVFLNGRLMWFICCFRPKAQSAFCFTCKPQRAFPHHCELVQPFMFLLSPLTKHSVLTDLSQLCQNNWKKKQTEMLRKQC